jgi:hypothetical protein
MLASYDLLDVVGEEGLRFLWQEVVFAWGTPWRYKPGDRLLAFLNSL